MKTLFLLRRAPYYSEAWTAGLIRAVDPDVVATFEGDPHPFEGRSFTLEPRRLARRAWQVMGSSVLERQHEALLSLIKRENVTRVFCNYLDLAVKLLPVWRRTDATLFVQAHGFDVTFDLRDACDPSKPVHPADYLEHALEVGRRGTIVANSDATKALVLRSGFLAEGVAICHLGVEVADSPKAHRANDAAHVVAIGRLVDFKAPDRTVRASSKALGVRPGARLDLFGEGVLRATVELERARLRNPETVVIHGSAPHEKVRESLAKASVFTQHNVLGEVSRQQEAFGVSLLEAGALGIPVVATRSGGVTETVLEAETGLLVEPGDEDAQAEAIATLLGDAKIRERMGEAAFEHVRTRFSLDAWRDRMQAIVA